MATTVKEMLAAAAAVVPRIAPQEARALLEQGDAVALDVRDAAELAASGKVAGAVHVPRGMLEFRADPSASSHDKALRPDKTVIVYCASGGRSALAGKTLLDLGYKDVRNLGGFKDWAEAGGPVERA